MKILLIDDHELFAKSIQISLSKNEAIEEFNVCTIPKKAITSVNLFRPDIVLMDIHMGEENGIKIAKEILTSNPFLKVVFLSGFDLLEYHKQCVKLGAKGFINKNVSIDGLIHHLKEVMEGKTVFPKFNDVKYISLTHREKQILQHLSDGLRQADIAELCGIRPRTIRNHIQQINDKLGVNSYLSAVVKGIELGIVSIKI